MKAKKLLAVALSLAMLIGLFPVAGLVSIAEETTPALGTNELTVYVSGSATGAADGTDAATATTLADALSKIAATDDTYGSGKIMLVDALSIPAGTVLDVGAKALTITSEPAEGAAASFLMTNSVVTVKSDLTLDNVIGILNGANSERGFALDGVTFTTTENYVSGYKTQELYEKGTNNGKDGACTIFTAAAAADNKANTIILKGGYFASVTVGAPSAKNATVKDLDLTIDGTAVIGAVYLFSRPLSPTTIDGDINITLIGSATLAGDGINALSKATTITDGHKITFVQINSKNTNATALKQASAEGCNLAENYNYYSLTVADGGSLTRIGAASFAVSGTKTAHAVATDSDVAVSSEQGVLTLTTPGVYTVSWAKSTAAKTIYVDGANGDDTLGNGYTKDTALKTLTAALTDAAGRESAEIRLIGDTEYDWPTGNVEYTAGGTTITGDGATPAKVKMGGIVTVKGSLKLDNMALAGNSSFCIHQQSYAVTFETTPTFSSGFAAFGDEPSTAKGPYIKYSREAIETPVTHKVILRGGYFEDIVLGANNTDPELVIAGADLEIDGATVDYLVLGTRTQKIKTTYTKDVNVVLKSGKASGVDVMRVPTFENGASLNIVQYAGFTMTKPDLGTYQYGSFIEGDAELLPYIPYYKVKDVPVGENTIVPVSGGVFDVSARFAATAVAGNAAVKSADGKLRLPTTGVYTGEWLGDANPLTVYVSAFAEEATVGDGLSEANPTDWTTAFNLLKGRISGTIKLVAAAEGVTLALPAEIPAVTDGELLITSADANNPVWVTMAKVDVYNDVTLDNFNVYVASSSDNIGNTHGFRLYGVTFKTTATFKSGYNDSSAGITEGCSLNLMMMANKSGVIEKSTIVLQGGYFRSVLLSNGAGTLMGADVTIDGAMVYTLGLDRFKQRLIYAGDVSIVLKSGSFPRAGTSYGIITRGGTVAEGKYVSVNDGVKIDIIRYAAFDDKSGHDDIFLFNETDTTSLDALLAARRWIDVAAGGTLTSDGEGSFDAVADKNGYRAMLSNETTALRYAEADKLPIPEKAGHYTVEWRKRGGIRTVYVSADGTGDGWTYDSPTTIGSALENNLFGQEAGVIRLVGDATLPATIPAATAGSITISKSAKTTGTPTLTLPEAVQVYNDLILDNVTLVQKHAAETSGNNLVNYTTQYSPRFELNGVYFETTANFRSGFLSSATDVEAAVANAPYIFLRSKGAAAAKSTVVLKGGYFNQLYIGGYAVAADMYVTDNDKKAAEIKGADITLDGAYIKNIYTYHRGSGGVKPGFTDDVNIFLKSGTVQQMQAVTNKVVYDNGAALNIFKYKGMSFPDDSTYSGKGILQDYADNIQGNLYNCAYYFFKNVPATVTDVVAGDEPGLFTFVSDSTPSLQATEQNTTTLTAKTFRGEMQLPECGVYTLTELADTSTGTETTDTPKIKYVDPASTAATQDGSKTNPYPTIKAAMDSFTAADATTHTRGIIKILGETRAVIGGGEQIRASGGSSLGNTFPVTIEGATPGTPANVVIKDGHVKVFGQVTFDNMKVALYKDGGGVDNAFQIFGGGVLTFGEDFQSGYYLTDTTDVATAPFSTSPQVGKGPNIYTMWIGNTNSTKTTVNIHGGHFQELVVGGTNGNQTLTGTDVLVDGSNVNINYINLGNRASNGVTTVKGDVNITLKRGKIVHATGIRGSKPGYPTVYENSVVRVLQSADFNLAVNAAPKYTNYGVTEGTHNAQKDTPFYKLVVPATLMDAFTPGAAGTGSFVFAAPAKVNMDYYEYWDPSYDGLGNAYDTDSGLATWYFDNTDGVLHMRTTNVDGYYPAIYVVESDFLNQGGTEAKDIYVDSELGHDFVGDGARLNPYKTLAAAFDDAAGRAGATIYLRGEATLDRAIPALTGGLSIVGISEYTTDTEDGKTQTEHKAVISITAAIDVNTDLTLDNVKLLATKLGDDRTGFVINGIEFTTTNTVSAGLDISNPNASANESVGPDLYIYSGASKPVVNIHGGNFRAIWAGYSPTSADTTEIVLPGAELNLYTRNQYLYIGNRKKRSIKFTDDLVITARNAGNLQVIQQLFGNCVGTTNGTIHRNFADGSTLKIYDYTENGLRKGDGVNRTAISTSSASLCADCVAGGIDKHRWIHMYVKSADVDTYYLEKASTADTYTIHGDKLGLLGQADGTMTVANKTLTVSESYTDVTLKSFDELVEVNNTDFTQIYTGMKMNGGYVDAANLPTGMLSLTPEYVTFTKNEKHDDVFAIEGAQLREDRQADNALRLIAKMDSDYYDTLTALFGEPERGMLLITGSMLSADDPLTFDGRYEYKHLTYKASSVVAKKLMLAYALKQNTNYETNYTYYNATLTGIPARNYKMGYAYRGYVTYTDKNGVEHTLYSADGNHSTGSVYKVTQEILQDDTTDANALHLQEKANAAGDPLYMYNADGTQWFSPADLYMGRTSKATKINEAAEAIRNKVLTSTDDVTKHITDDNVTTIYISGTGSDETGAGTITNPFRTSNVEAVYNALNKGNCNILFERGYVYREIALMVYGSNVFIGAYGESKIKPILVGSDKNYAEKAEYWELYNKENNIWRADVTEIMDHDYSTKVISPDGSSNADLTAYNNLYSSDIGAIVFDHGRMMASTGKVMSNDKNEISSFDDKKVQDQLANDFDFWSAINPDETDDKYYVYLKFSAGNPAEHFTSIEMLPNRYIVYANKKNAYNVWVDNLSLKYSCDAVGTSGVNDVSITNCEMGYMGGSVLNGSGYQRHGNGITIYGKTDGAVVENNWAYQCYDDAYTNQAELGTQQNITVKNNLFEYSMYGMTMWTGKHHSKEETEETPEECAEKGEDYLRNITVEGNVMRFAGFSHGTFNRGRFGSSTVGSTHLSVGSEYSWLDNVVIKDNYFDTSYRYLARVAYYGDASEFVFIGNTWNHKPYSRPHDLADVLGTTAVVARVQEIGADDTIVYYGATENEVYTSVNAFDVKPGAIYFDGKLVTGTPSAN